MNSKLPPGLLRLVAFALFLLIGPLADAAEIAASGLSFPFFNEAGTLTHKLVAKSGAAAGNVQQLSEIEVEYYESGDPRRVTQRVIASEATWDANAEVLVGRSKIRVETEENTITGEGFRFELARAQVNIHRAFRMTNPEVAVTSDRAVVDLVLERRGDDDVKLRDVKRSEAIGNLRVKILPTAKKKYDFDEAHSDRAIYLGATHTIEIPQETRFQKNGRPAGSTNQFTMRLDAKTRPAQKLKSN